MSSGEFAARSGLSLKALRLYASSGLLAPQYTDPTNGYRYYSHEQLPAAETILLLRGAGRSLGEIQRFLDEPSVDQLETWQEEAEADARRRRECFAEVRRRHGWTPTSKESAISVDVRPIRSHDELHQVFDTVGSYLTPPLDSSDRRFADLSRRFGDDQDVMLVAEHEGSRIGGALAFLTDDEGCTLRMIGVAPRNRRRGVGRKLVSEVERAAVGIGVTQISLGADNAVGFWLRLGYRLLLLLQWVFDAALFDEEATRLAKGLLSGLELKRSTYDGVPQLFVQLDESDMDLRDNVRAQVAGCHVGYCLTKQLGHDPMS